MKRSVVAAMVVLAVVGCGKQRRGGGGDGPPGSATPPPLGVECSSDADCVIEHGHDCCGNPCGDTPPWRAVNARADHEAGVRARAACALEARKCPEVSCESPPECRTRPIPRCRAGRCAVEVVLDGSCAGWSCPARCGAQPPAPPDDSYQCGIRYEWGWAACCCEAASADAGPRACATLRQQACSWASACKVRPEDLAPTGPLPTCETPAP